MSYRNLEVWRLAREQSIEIHKMTMNLPSHEMFETGQQIRRASKSVRSNIVEGYGRKNYPKEYHRFIIFALASNDETIDHLEVLFETGSLNDEELFHKLHKNATKLGVKLNNFHQSLLHKIHR